jgi:hypothetical protein
VSDCHTTGCWHDGGHHPIAIPPGLRLPPTAVLCVPSSSAVTAHSTAVHDTLLSKPLDCTQCPPAKACSTEYGALPCFVDPVMWTQR